MRRLSAIIIDDEPVVQDLHNLTLPPDAVRRLMSLAQERKKLSGSN